MGCIIESTSNINSLPVKPIQQELPSRKELQNQNQIKATTTMIASKKEQKQKQQLLNNVTQFEQKIQIKQNEKLQSPMINNNDEEEEKQYLQICYQKAANLFEGMKESQFDLMLQQIKKIDPSYDYCKGWASKGTNNYIPHLLLAIICYIERNYQQAENHSQKCIQLNSKAFRACNILANCYYQKKEIQNAKIWYKKCVEINPKFQTPYQNLGKLCKQQKQYQEGLHWYLQVIEINPKKERNYFLIGDLYFCMENSEKAIEYYRKCVTINSKHGEACLYLGELYRIKKKYDEALFWLHKSQKINPTNPQCWLLLGYTYHYDKNYEEAIKYSLKCFEAGHKTSKYCNQIAQLYFQSKQYQTSVKWYEKAIEVNPKEPANYYNIGKIYRDLKNYKQAVNWLKKRIQIDSMSSEAYLLLGVSYELQKQNQNAIDVYLKGIELFPKQAIFYSQLGGLLSSQEYIIYCKKAIEINPQSDLGYLSLGAAYYKIQKYEDCIIEFRKCIEINPKNQSALHHIGNTCYQMKNYDQAIFWFKKCIEAKPDYRHPYNGLGLVYMQKGQFEQAVKWFKKCLQIDPTMEKAMYNIGINFAQQNQFEQAIIWFQKALKLAPNQSRTYDSLGTIYFRLDNVEKAKQCFQKCLQLDTKDGTQYIGLGNIYKQQNPQLAMQMYKKCIQLNPRQFKAYFNIGQIYIDKKQYEEAIIWYKKCLEFHPQTQESSCQIGQCYYFLQRYNEAIQEMEASLKTYPNSVELHFALAKIYFKVQNFSLSFQTFQKAKICMNEKQKSLIFSKNRENYIQTQLKQFQKQYDEWKEIIKNSYLKEEDKKSYQIMRKKFEDKFVKVFKNDQTKERKKQVKLQSEETQHFLKTMELIRNDKYELQNMVQITKAVKQMYNEDQGKFHIIPRLICQSFWIKHFKNGQMSEKIQQLMKKIIIKLCQEFPSTSKKSQDIIEIQLPEQYRTLKRIEVNIFEEFEYFSSYEVLFAEIQKVNYKAMQQLIPFRNLVNKIAKNCKGDHPKFGLKLPSKKSQWFKVLIRILQKMFKEQLKDKDKKMEIIRKIDLQLLAEKNTTMEAIVLTIMKVWIEEINHILKTRKQMKIPTKCFLSDLVRGKCLFNSISDIAVASQMIIKECHQNNFQICQIDNKLHESAQSFVFKIKIKSIVAEFQLALVFDETQFQFGHSLYQIERSPLGTIFGSYLFLSKGVKYDMIAQSSDILNEIKLKNTGQFDHHIQVLMQIIQDFEETSK